MNYSELILNISQATESTLEVYEKTIDRMKYSGELDNSLTTALQNKIDNRRAQIVVASYFATEIKKGRVKIVEDIEEAVRFGRISEGDHKQLQRLWEVTHQ